MNRVPDEPHDVCYPRTKPDRRSNMKIKQLEDRRTILTHNGEPMLVTLGLRESTTASGRIKAMLVVEIQVDGNEAFLPLPFAAPVINTAEGPPSGFTPEFRLEMN